MSLSHNDRRARVGSEARARAQQLESRLKRFPEPHRAAVRALGQSHPALADLSLSFPGLLFALAAPRDTGAGGRGREAVTSGKSLREAAEAAGVPMWLRALPPEAFAERLCALPDGALFARRIANHAPATPQSAALWLRHVGEAARAGDEAIAVWVAQEFARAPAKFEADRLHLVCLWAWFSARPETLAGALCRKRWSPRLTFARAAQHAGDWLESVEAVFDAGPGAADGWLAPGRFGGFEFAPLLSAADLIAQARAMRNCVRTYGSSLRSGYCRLWTVRRDGDDVATVEIGLSGPGRFLVMSEARGRSNRDLPVEVERTIHEWVRSQPLQQAPAASEAPGPDRAAWMAYWRPYWLAKRRFPEWLPLAPSTSALHRLRWSPHRRLRRRRRA